MQIIGYLSYWLGQLLSTCKLWRWYTFGDILVLMHSSPHDAILTFVNINSITRQSITVKRAARVYTCHLHLKPNVQDAAERWSVKRESFNRQIEKNVPFKWMGQNAVLAMIKTAMFVVAKTKRSIIEGTIGPSRRSYARHRRRPIATVTSFKCDFKANIHDDAWRRAYWHAD